MRFKKGQEIVCIKGGAWSYTDDNSYNTNAPKFNEIVTCDGVAYDGYIYLVEYSYNRGVDCIDIYDDSRFEPLISDKVLEEDLSTIAQYQDL